MAGGVERAPGPTRDEGKMSEIGHIYTVIGVYEDPAYQRFCQTYQADDAEMAEEVARREHPGLVVAGVIAGIHPALDTHESVAVERPITRVAVGGAAR